MLSLSSALFFLLALGGVNATYNVRTVVGTGSSTNSGTGGQATAAGLNSPRALWLDSAGVVYFVEYYSSCARSMDTSGIIHNFGGVCGTGGSTGDGGPATSALLNNVVGVFVSTVGIAYLSDYTNNKVRSVSVSGTMTTVVGTGLTVDLGDGGKASAASIYGPYALWCNTNGVMYIGAASGYKVRSVDTSNIITTYAGTGVLGFSGDGGPATSAGFEDAMLRVFGTTTGKLYVSTALGHRIRVVSSTGIISTYIGGTGSTSYSGENVAITSCNLNYPDGIAVDPVSGDVYIDDFFQLRVYYISATTSKVTTFAGTGVSGSSGDGGPATSALFAGTDGIYLNTVSTSLYVVDQSNNKIRLLYTATVAPTASPTSVRTTQNNIQLFAGAGSSSSTGDGGPATSANLLDPRSIWFDTAGVSYVSQSGGYCTRKIDTSNIISTFAGQCGTTGSSGDGGKATSALTSAQVSLFVTTTGEVYMADFNNNKVRMVSASNIITTVAGTGASSDTGDGGKATSASFYNPNALWMNSNGVLYIGSYSSNKVRAVSTSSIASTFTGTGTASFGGDGGQATSALITTPQRVVGDTAGAVYISEGSNCRVRSVSTSGIITTYMGTGSTVYNGEGLAGTSLNLNLPTGMWVDSSSGDFYLSSYMNNRVHIMSGASKTVTTLAGTGSASYGGDGGAATAAQIYRPDGMYLVQSSSQLYVVGDGENRVRLIYTAVPTCAPTVVPTLTPSIAPSCLPTVTPTQPTLVPTLAPSQTPSLAPTAGPTSARTTQNSIKLFAGAGSSSSTGDGGPATSANLLDPRSIWFDTAGVAYVSFASGYCTRKIDTSSIISAFAGSCGTSGTTGDGGKATAALTSAQVSLFVSTVGEVYIADYSNNKVRMVSASNIITTVAGTGASSDTGDGGKATSASFYNPNALWMNSNGVLYIGSYSSNKVRAVSTSSIASTFTGTGSASFGGDGGQATSAFLNGPQRAFGDTAGVLYISEGVNHRVRAVATSGIISTFMGTGSKVYNGEGLAGTSLNLNTPTGMWVDSSNGDFYLSSYGTYRVHLMSGASKTVSTLAGTGSASYGGDGGAATAAQINCPDGMYLVQSTLQLYVVGQVENRVRLIYTAVPTAAPTQPTLTPSVNPSIGPTIAPTIAPTTLRPTVVPTVIPSQKPSTIQPSVAPSKAPTIVPSVTPTHLPSISMSPTISLTKYTSYEVTNDLAFAGITSKGTVMAWGSSLSGGDCSYVSSQLVNVVVIVSSKNAFAALTSAGAVVAWGRASDISGWQSAVSGVTITSLVATEQAFAGVTSDGAVVAFGAGCCGGNVDQYGAWSDLYLNEDVVSVRASSGAFCALKTDGSVYCWGNKFTGGGVSSVSRNDLANLVFVTSTRSAFAGLTSSGSVVVWGSSRYGGVLSSSISSKLSGNTEILVSNSVSFSALTYASQLQTWGEIEFENITVHGGVLSVAHTASAFAAMKSNGSVVSWGDTDMGGGVSLYGSCSSLVGNSGAFAAVSADGGTVSVWGSSYHGGVLSSTVDGVVSVYHTSGAFAAMKSDGSVVAWGAEAGGGSVPDGVASYLTSNVKLLCTNDVAFTAILSDGTAVAWGHASSVSNGVFTGNYSSINSC